ncbi:MAG TPA: transporter substrate-binding domain-containing protein [Burkholderiaceae bacterium]
MLIVLSCIAARTAIAHEAHDTHTALNICAAPLPPYVYLKQGVPAGIELDVAHAVFDPMGVQFKVDVVPFARCQLEIQTGQADAALTYSPTPAREAIAYFPKTAVWRISYLFFTNAATKARYDIRGLDDAKRSGLSIGVVRGASYHDEFWKVFPRRETPINDGYDPALIAAADTQENFHQLALNHIQLFPQDMSAGLWAARAAGQTPVWYDTVLFSKEYSTAFSKASTFSSAHYPDIAALMKDYDARLEAFKKTPQYRALFAHP